MKRGARDRTISAIVVKFKVLKKRVKRIALRLQTNIGVSLVYH